MSKRSIALAEDDAEPIPAFLRSRPLTIVPDDESGVVAPLTEPAPEPEPEPEPTPEPSRELTDGREPDLKALEAEVLEMCAEPINPTSLAYEVRCGQVSEVRRIEGIRNGYADRRELLTCRFEEAKDILDHKIADAEEALGSIINGIGPAA